jgi:CxxC motif-containing protein
MIDIRQLAEASMYRMQVNLLMLTFCLWQNFIGAMDAEGEHGRGENCGSGSDGRVEPAARDRRVQTSDRRVQTSELPATSIATLNSVPKY